MKINFLFAIFPLSISGIIEAEAKFLQSGKQTSTQIDSDNASFNIKETYILLTLLSKLFYQIKMFIY